MDPFEVLYLIGRDAPTAMLAFGWSLLINGAWALAWAVGR